MIFILMTELKKMKIEQMDMVIQHGGNLLTDFQICLMKNLVNNVKD